MIQYEKTEEIKLSLTLLIVEFLKTNKLSQVAVARKLDISQPRISEIIHGKLDKFSIDYLLNIALVLGICRKRIANTFTES